MPAETHLFVQIFQTRHRSCNQQFFITSINITLVFFKRNIPVIFLFTSYRQLCSTKCRCSRSCHQIIDIIPKPNVSSPEGINSIFRRFGSICRPYNVAVSTGCWGSSEYSCDHSVFAILFGCFSPMKNC